MLREFVFVLSCLALARAQIPSLGFCPDYVPMANFDMEKFMGVWYEAERYFQLSEIVSRCAMANYTKRNDGKYHVSNEVTNRFTGIKRILEGEIRPAASKSEEGKLHVKYTTIPLTPETKYSVLETDYDTYAVLWSCAGIGPFRTQNAWIMSRQRLPPGEILQKAYGVLDKYKISKTFFVKADQDDCAFLANLPLTTPKPAVVESQAKSAEVAPSLNRDSPNAIVQTRKTEVPVPEEIKEEIIPLQPVVVEQVPENVVAPNAQLTYQPPVPIPATVPEVILKAAEQAKEKLEEMKSENIEKVVEPAKETVSAAEKMQLDS